MKRFVWFSLLAMIAAASVWAEPVWEGDWSKIRRYGHGQERDLFTEEQLAYIDDNIAYLTCEKIHGTDVFSGGNLDQAAMATADDLQHTKVLLYLQAYYAFGRWQAEVAADYSNTNLFIYDGGMTDYAFNQGTVEGREFWASISDNCVNTSKVVGTYVDAIGKISTHGHSDWLPEFRKTLSQLDGLTIYNGPPSDLLDDSEGCMREDFIEGNIENMRTYLDLFLQVPDEEYMMLNSFHPDYQFALAGFLIIAHDKSFLRLYPDGGNNWNDVLWHCDEYDNPLGPPKGKGVRTGDWTYERSFEYADVWLDLKNTNSTITWYEAPVAHWNMEDGSGTTVSDVSGNGFDGTLSGGAWVSGVNGGGALELNGSSSSDSVRIPAELFDSVTNEITIAMWVKGDAAQQPRGDSVFEAKDASGNRLFNIHLPWSNSTVYWDAGGSSGFDRISKTATAADFEGVWNHWAFTKNSATGTMNIYLNGVLWHSASGKTSPMTSAVATACFGSGVDASYYEGALDDVRIYNRELSEADIAVMARTRPVADPVSVSMDEDGGSVSITLSGTDAGGNAGSSLTYTVGTKPANGTLTGTAPNLIYTPDADFFGTDRMYFIVNDGEANSYAAEVLITVNAVDDVPVASAQNVGVTQNEAAYIELAGTDADGDALKYSIVSYPVHGTLTGTAPDLTYMPGADYVGGDSFSFIVNDGQDDSDPATVSILVSPIIIYTATYMDSDSAPVVSNDDLAQTQYLTSSATGENGVATEHAELFNGLVGSTDNNTSEDGVVSMDSSNTFTIELDTSVNTDGYSITGIDSYFGWDTNSGGRANQGYEIILTLVDGSTGTLAGPEHWASNSPVASYWTVVSFAEENGGVMATGVKALTFDITEDANPGGVVIAREFDIFGTPTTVVDPDESSFTPDPDKTYYIDSPRWNMRLAATGESEDAYMTSITTTGADVEWKFVDKGNGYWHIDRAAGGSIPRLRTDNSEYADMQSTSYSGVYTYYGFTAGAYADSHLLTVVDGPDNYKRLQVDNSKIVKMVSESSADTWESFTITEVGADDGNNEFVRGDLTFDSVDSTTVYDGSAYGNDATRSGGTIVDGISGDAMYFDGVSDLITLPAEMFASIDNEVTVAMWVYGGADQPRQDSILQAVNASGERVLNIHLPWSNGSVYWDAGNDGTVDRINKLAAADEYMGQWNHWVFTKNATTGEMAIYLNGELWHSGTGKTKSMAGISAATLGGEVNGLYYQGTIDDVRFYTVSLDAAEVSDLYTSYLSATYVHHPGGGKIDVLSEGLAYQLFR